MIDQPPLVLCSWPGLAGLWLRGRWTSLMVAIGFSFLLNLALVSTFVWPALLSDSVKVLLWPCLAVAWVIGAWNSWRMLNALQKNGAQTSINPPAGLDDTLFIQAQTEYLKGDYPQSESLLAQRLQQDQRDVESRLLLAAVFQRSGRLEKAARQLDMLGRLDEARNWHFEIERLRKRIHQEDEEREESEDSVTEDNETVADANNENDESVTRNDVLDLTNQEGQSATHSVAVSEPGKVKLGQTIRSNDSTESHRLKMEDHDDLTHDPDDIDYTDRQAA